MDFAPCYCRKYCIILNTLATLVTSFYCTHIKLYKCIMCACAMYMN